MNAFPDNFEDLSDFILKMTLETWEGRGLTSVEDYFSEDVTIRTPLGLLRGDQELQNQNLICLSEFPDKKMFGETVIWTGDEEAGFLASQRLYTTGTHLGHGAFGPPTGNSFACRMIADYAVKDAKIVDGWAITDRSGLCAQLGIEPRDYAKKLIAREGGPENCDPPLTPAQDLPGAYRSTGNNDRWGTKLGNILNLIMSKDFAVIPDVYDRACHIHHPGGRHVVGLSGADALWLPLRAAFPNARFTIEHVIGQDNPMMGPEASVRWSLNGRHEGFGAFGEPTGAEVHIMGITQAEFGPYGTNGWSLRREYTVYDEVAIWKQIEMQQR